MKTMNAIIEKIRNQTNSVLVGFSCGKDSVVTLDLCCQNFKRVEAFFMYLVPGLSFQEKYLAYIENRFSVTIHRLPHWQLGAMLNSASFRPGVRGREYPTLKVSDCENFVRQKTGLHWIAYGQKANDSFERRAMLKRCQGINEKSGRFYPIMRFSKEMVFRHMLSRNIMFAPDYKYWGRSFGRLWPTELRGIKKHFPSDYQKIQEYFPYVEAVIKRQEFGNHEVPEVREGDDQPKRDKKRAVQSKAN